MWTMQSARKMFCLLLLFVMPIISISGAEKEQALKNRMLSDLDVIKNTYEVKYAPAEWKKTLFGWDLDKEISAAKAKVIATKSITIRDYQQILKSFFKGIRDYHVGVHFYSTESAFLPFRVQGANGRYFLTWIDKTAALPSSWAVGDEVVLFDNETTEEAIQTIKKNELGNPESLTDQGMAELFLTARLGPLGHATPKGPISVVIQHAATGQSATYNLEWSYTPEEVSGGPNKLMAMEAAAMAVPFSSMQSIMQNRFFQKEMSACFYEQCRAVFQRQYSAEQLEEGAELLGNKKGFLPALGKIVWQSAANSNFHAYLFKTPDQKTVGYIRIPEYMGGSVGAEDFAKLIRKFEAQSDALVIDQVNNPGGNLFYMYALASMFAKTPLKVPTHRTTITQEDVYFALEAIQELESESAHLDAEGGARESDQPSDTISGYPVTADLIKSLISHFHFIINEWNAGNHFTHPGFIYGIEAIPTHPQAKYTKPVLVLVNHLAFSCGDFFPAILQDNKRATILGTQTAGAGGFVLHHAHPNRFGVGDYTFTGSIAERMDKNPLENLGVVPDIVYSISQEDLQGSYKGYIQAIHQALNNLLKPKK